MGTKPGAWYEARVCIGLASLLPALGMPLFAGLNGLLWMADSQPPTTYELVRAFEVVLPLSAGLAAAHLMTVEQEEGIGELRRSYPEPAWLLPVRRTIAAIALVILAAICGATVFRGFFGQPFSAAEVIVQALPPAIFLLGLSLVCGNLSQNFWAAGAAVMGYWFFELQMRGELTGILFLFNGSWPLDGISHVLNRWLLAGAGITFLLLNAWVSIRRQRASLGRRTVGRG